MPDSYFDRLGARTYKIEGIVCQPCRRWPLHAGNGGNRSDRPALTLAIVNARKEQVMRDEREHKVETAVEARAGFLDRPVLAVLCVSLALAVIVLGALWFGFFTPGT
jgi:hypothetical protein